MESLLQVLKDLFQAFKGLSEEKATLVSGILGGILGGAFSLAGSWLMWRLQRRDEIVRWKREDATRFHAEKRPLYAGFLMVATSLSDAIFQDGVASQDLLRDEERLFWEISLLAPSDINEVAQAIHVALTAISRNSEQHRGDKKKASDFAELLAGYRNRCRAELGAIVGGLKS